MHAEVCVHAATLTELPKPRTAAACMAKHTAGRHSTLQALRVVYLNSGKLKVARAGYIYIYI